MTNEANQPLNIPAVVDKENFSCAIAVASWNAQITQPLLTGALDVLAEAGICQDAIHVLHVPGSVELVNAAALAINAYNPSAVIISAARHRISTTCARVSHRVPPCSTRVAAHR